MSSIEEKDEISQKDASVERCFFLCSFVMMMIVVFISLSSPLNVAAGEIDPA